MPAGSFVHNTIGNYRLLDFVGAGGMGEVYRAARMGTGEIVAVKILLSAQGPEMLTRFRNEARIHAALRHPNIAAMREFIESADVPAIAMEYVEGDTIESRIRQRGGLSMHEALPLLAPIVDAIGYMHQRGVLHRDIKPTNVKIARDGTPKLLDFGIAKSAQSPKLTALGAVIGTWHYLSPEQLSTGVADARSDIWALGVLLYEMVSARLPFEGDSMASLTQRILQAEYTPASRHNRSVSSAFDRVIARCLTVRVSDRYQNAESMLRDLQTLMAPVVTPAQAVPVRAAPVQAAQVRAAQARAGLALAAPVQAARDRGIEMLQRWGAPLQSRSPVAVVLGLAAVVGVIAYQVTPRAGENSDIGARHGGDSAVIAVSGDTTPPAVNVFNYAPTQITDSQTVSVTTLELPADVWVDGRRVGTTPFTTKRQIGSEVQLVLKRQGYRDSVVRFPVLIGKPEYNIQLERIVPEDLPDDDQPQPSDDAPLDDSPMVFAGAALFLRRMFGRSAPSISAHLKSTQELGLVANSVDAAMPFTIESGMATDAGCVRTGNEDSVRVVRNDAAAPASAGDLAVVCDGMGGHEGGEIASRLAIDAVLRHFADDAHDVTASLARSVEKANREVFEAAARDTALTGMGTTCTAVLIKGNHAYCAHVGDSRLYLVRDGEIFLMTEDHSEVMELVRRGVISREDARHHPDKNVIVRALGVRREVAVTSWPQPFGIRANDRFLVCSDGLSDLVEESEILTAVLEYGTQGACDRLVALAREHGGFDNISLAMLAVSPRTNGAGTVKATRVVEVPS